MKKLLLLTLFISAFTLAFGQAPTVQPGDFVTIWDTSIPSSIHADNTPSTNTQIKFAARAGNYTIYWVDINDNTRYNNAGIVNPGSNYLLEFGKESKYRVIVRGQNAAFRFYFGNPATKDAYDRNKITDIEQWGGLNLTTNGGSAFRLCAKLNISAPDAPQLGGSLGAMFLGCAELVGSAGFNTWNLSSVNALNNMFQDCTIFNANISNWETNNVTKTYSMFYGARAFNQPINTNDNKWNMEKVDDMSNMFRDAESFNQSLADWNTSSVTTMNSMFYGAKAFNMPVNTNGNKWNVEKVENMSNMFRSATVFNQPLNSWNILALTNIVAMFQGANGTTRNNFNQPLDHWNTEKIISMSSVFRDCDFDQNIGNWSLKGVTSLADIFRGNNNTGISCANFTKTIQGWSSNPNTPTGLSLGTLATTLKHGDQIAYDNLTGSGTGQKGWTIASAVSYDATCAGTLPVNFLAINATLNGNILLMQWQTASEQNNDYFNIYASEDGKTWQELGKVNSKAVNGNSNTALSYEYSTAYSSSTVQLAGISVLGALALAFLAFNRRNRWLISATAVVCFGVFFSSCQKNELLGEQDATTAYNKQSNKAIYIKVMQTDKDGKTSESGIVVVNRK